MAKKTTPQDSRPLLVVAIGSSAGGVTPLRKFLSSLGEPKQLAFVLAQHLSEDGSHLAHDVLTNDTRLDVVEIETGTQLRSGVVYHAPSHSLIELNNGIFHVRPAIERPQQFTTIDHMMTSISKDQGERSVGIIFSGVGSDGTQGLKEINQAGGMTIAQNPEAAEFPPMPLSAISQGVVDHVLDVEEMSEQILNYADYLERLLVAEPISVLQNQIKTSIDEICEVLHKRTKHDFKHYKVSTLVRRIQRRMQVLQLADAHTYAQHLEIDPKESEALFKELLINVTSFFRDDEAFEYLKMNVLTPALTGRRKGDKYRIWVAGCSTGEEVYTMAIIVREILETLQFPPDVQIIATDIDEEALRLARRGTYPVTIAEHVSPARLKKYFTKKGGKYLVTKELRELVLFSLHNLINDPPFSQLDLISCRNVMIYLGSHLQKKLIPVFHYALRHGGYLFLGSSESLTTHKELFKTESTKFRIGQRKQTAIHSPTFSTRIPTSYVHPSTEPARNPETDIHLIAQRIVLDEFAPRYAVVNDECKIISVSGGVAQYFDPTEGAFQNNLMKIVKPALRVGLRTAFHEAKKSMRKVTHQDSALNIEDELARIGITVQPMPHLGDDSQLFMVVFHYFGTLHSKAVDHPHSSVETGASLLVVEQLERELSALRVDLDRSVQDLEASNEELKSSNEELLSMNEELQSANEELETSKEDVQGVNDALQRTNSDLENLLASTEIATLFLNDELKIQNFTPQLESIYNVSSVDIGRPIAHITTLAREMPPLPPPSDIVPGRPVESDLQLLDGRSILRRISSYRTAQGAYSGMVVTFIDVTHLRVAEQRYRQLADSMPHIIWTATPAGEVDYFNRRWYEYTGGNLIDGPHSREEIIHPADLQRARTTWDASIRSGKPYEIEFRYEDRVRGGYRHFLGRAVPARNIDGEIVKWYGSSVDINDRVVAEESRRESERRFQIMADTAPILVWFAGADRLCTWFNRGWLAWTGRTMEQEIGNGWTEGVHPDDFERCLKIYVENFEKRLEFSVEYRLKNAAGEYRYISNKGVPRFTPNGTFEGFIGACMDIHDQRVSKERLIESERRLETLIRTSPSFMGILKVEGDQFIYESTNEKLLELVGQRELVGKNVIDALPELEGQAYGKLLRQVRDTATPFIGQELEFHVSRTPGEPPDVRSIDFVYQPADIQDGRAGRILVHGNDVTDKVRGREILIRAASEISNERENFRNLFEQTPEMVCILTGPDHKFEFVNEAHVRVLGFDATGKTVREAQPDSVEVYDLLDGVYQTGKTAELNEIPVTVGGRVRYFNLTYAARRDSAGKINGVMILGLEITQEVNTRTDLKTAKDEAERQKRAAETANESKTRFLANMSHEIRTPLAAILGYSELLKGRTTSGDTEAASQLDRISRNASHLGRLIDELLDLSKIEAEKFEIETSDFDLLNAVEDTLASVSLMARQKGLSFSQKSVGDVPRFITTDQTRFKQVLTNIIGNAVKFTESGRVDVEFRHLSSVGKDYLQVRVTDTGIGLSPDQAEKLFEPFVQADTSVTRKYGGTGLGLVLSRRLARLLGGELTLETSLLGQGSTFLLKIEIRIPDSKMAPASLKPNVQNVRLDGARILIVDDSTDNQTIIRLFLMNVGAKVDLANNGLEAVQLMKASRYDVVLMDIQMPVMDGYQALKVANENGYRGPILALTAHALKEEKDRCLAAGFSDYMSKPINRTALIQRLSDLQKG